MLAGQRVPEDPWLPHSMTPTGTQMGVQQVFSSTRPPQIQIAFASSRAAPGEYLDLVHQQEWGEIVKSSLRPLHF